MKRNLLAATFVLAGTILTGCAGGAYVVAASPPPPRYGVMGYAPGPGYVWTEGFYDLGARVGSGSRGAWRRPPRPGRAWVAPVWVRAGNSWRLRSGYWR